MFKHFEADGKIVIAGKLRQFRKVGRYKIIGGNEQPVAINVISIEALNEVHTDLLEGPQPCAATAANIHDTPRLNKVADKWSDHSRRLKRAGKLTIEKAVVVNVPGSADEHHRVSGGQSEVITAGQLERGRMLTISESERQPR